MLFRSDLDLSALALGEVSREGRVYVAPVEPCVRVQTPTVTLATGVDGAFAGLAVAGAFADFVSRAEQALLDACLAAKASWLRRDVSDESLRDNFRSFVSDGVLRVKVDAGVAAFDADGQAIGADEIPAGARARAVLELARVCFGRAEFGGIWRLTQVQLVRAPELLLTPEPAPAEPVADAEPDAAADLAESVEEFL